MKKTTAKKGAKKKITTKKAVKTNKKNAVQVRTKVKTCENPTTLFEVEFPTTVLFWCGVALFFFFLLLICRSVLFGF